MIERPKRKKSKDNPYTLKIINGKYYVVFKNSKLKEEVVEINEKIFNEMDKFELEDISQMHKFDRHIEHQEVYEETLSKKAVNKPISVEEMVEKKILNEELKKAINSLSDIPKRRIIMYYFYNKNLRQIAEIENCSIMSVKDSIDNGLKKIKKFLKI